MSAAAVPLLAFVDVRACALIIEQNPPLWTATLITAYKVTALVRALSVADFALINISLTAVSCPSIFANTAKQIS